ncbi:hypothetical protein RRG08_062723 [Elysia crispata]|uniref:Uncharacterized protein n=1 Tax=Elysia crispata TaxID=231223 RepID=A0AAE1DVY3_9GAST|nr:hypothetical protein RRG08_062723 [Elysia crispata]
MQNQTLFNDETNDVSISHLQIVTFYSPLAGVHVTGLEDKVVGEGWLPLALDWLRRRGVKGSRNFLPTGYSCGDRRDRVHALRERFDQAWQTVGQDFNL